MNPDLLKKCLSGKASASEWEAYLSWMNGDASDDDLDNLGQDPELLKNSILNRVIQKNGQLDRIHKRRKKLAIGISIAASLFCVLYLSFLFHTGQDLHRSQVFRYQAQASQADHNFNGISVQLAKNSQVSFNQHKKADIDLQFLGAVMLSNKSAEDQHITIQHQNDEVKRMCLRKGHSYLLSYLNFKYEEVIIVDKQNMNEIPPALAMNMKQQFNL